MRLSIVAAVSENGVIGHKGKLPWRLPDELQYLKSLTTGHCIILGRKTFESVGRPLPNRTSIVLTRRDDFAPDGVVVVHDLEAAIQEAKRRDETETFVFGGAAVYAMALPRVDRLYLTRVHADVEGDVHFPRFDVKDWMLVEERHHPADDRHAYSFCLQTLARRD
jgi:dihydrofolate reductase